MKYKITPQLLILRLHLLNLKTLSEKRSLPLYGKSWVQIYSQFVSSRDNHELIKHFSINLILEDFKNSDMSFILYSNPQQEKRKPEFKFGDKGRILQDGLTFRKVIF